MEMKLIKLESGKVRLIVYTREYVESAEKYVRSVVKDIYANLPDFNEPIVWIQKLVVTKKGKTVADVLDEYTEKYGEDAFIMCQAGQLVAIPDINHIDPSELNHHIDSMIGYALEAYFYRILLNRCMGHSFGYSDLCIYSNDKTEQWIEDNSGSDKIIKGVMSANKM